MNDEIVIKYRSKINDVEVTDNSGMEVEVKVIEEEEVDKEEVWDEVEHTNSNDEKNKVKERKRKSRKTLVMGNSLSCITENKVERNELLHGVANTDVSEQLAYPSNIEATISEGFIFYLMHKEKKYKEFSRIFRVAFSNQINNTSFINYIYCKQSLYSS